MNVEIVYPDDGWFLQRVGEYLVNSIKFAKGSLWKPNHKKRYDLTYFINYHLYQPCDSKIVGGYFTHEENEEFKEIAKKVDFAVCMCERYRKVIDTVNKNNYVIYQPNDLEILKPKLILGYASRSYNSGRKGEHLLKKVAKLPFVEIKKAEGQLKFEDMGKFYNSIDYILITSKIEGGPMCLTEGLACGKEIITTDVGMVPELKDCKYVHVFDRSKKENLFKLLEELYEKK